MKKWKKVAFGALIAFTGLTLAACGTNDTKDKAETKDSAKENKKTEEIIVGVCPGPYGEMIEEVIAPLMKEKGFDLKVQQFNDYIQPDKALNSGDIDANLMQHTTYLKKFSADNKLDLTAVQSVPTLSMGIYSNKYKKLADIKEGSSVSVANDPTNLARTLQVMAANDLITLKAEVDETKATLDDIDGNPKKLEFQTLDAAQLARSLDNVDFSLVPGNFSWAAGLKPGDALASEVLTEDYKNVVAVRTEDLKSDLGKAFKEVLDGQDFKDAIEASKFKDFQKPAFWEK